MDGQRDNTKPISLGLPWGIIKPVVQEEMSFKDISYLGL